MARTEPLAATAQRVSCECDRGPLLRWWRRRRRSVRVQHNCSVLRRLLQQHRCCWMQVLDLDSGHAQRLDMQPVWGVHGGRPGKLYAWPGPTTVAGAATTATARPTGTAAGRTELQVCGDVEGNAPKGGGRQCYAEPR